MADQPPKYIILLGPPASGKGTQAALLKDHLGLPHVSSGDLFRDNIRRRTDLGEQANAYIERGELVPDDITIAMVLERLGRPDARAGALLDGFPRTLAQAQALDQALQQRGRSALLVPNIEVADEILIERVSGRLLCRNCGESYHIKFKPPKTAGVCDKCGGELYQREDDRPETVRTRLGVYHSQTAPLIDYYRQRGVLIEVDGDQPIDQVQADLRSAIKES